MNSILLFVGLYAHTPFRSAWLSHWLSLRPDSANERGRKRIRPPFFITEAALQHGIGLRI